jgi:alkylated DNA repair protein alkB family protein 1
MARELDFSDFCAQAATVNYYHMDSTLSGHTDHPEPNKDAPLFSFSLTDTVLMCIWNVNDMHLPSVVDLVALELCV